jgi:hypothetical protein
MGDQSNHDQLSLAVLLFRPGKPEIDYLSKSVFSKSGDAA